MKRLLQILVLGLISTVAFASDAAGIPGDKSLYAIASALAIGLGALGGAIGQGIAASAALEGISRNPSVYNKLFITMIIVLALIESIVIYALVISFLLKP